jgi:glycosyltransferase involved in cell wall biosynthesis
LRVLVLATGRLDRPRSGGELRVHHLCRELAALGHHVDVHCFVARNHPGGGPAPLAEGCSLWLHHSAWLDAALAADRLGLVPITELPLWLAPLRGWARRLGASGRYDVAHFELPWLSAAASALAPPTRVVYGAQNVEWIWWRQALLRRPLGRFWRARLWRHELAALARADGAVACSEADRRWLARHGGPRMGRAAAGVALVPNGYDARRVRPATLEARARVRRELGFGEGEKIALFVGSDVPPNRQAAALLLRQARGGQPKGVVLAIAGRACRSLGGEPLPSCARLLGEREDILPLLQAADVGLVPMLAGSGSNLKLIESCAAGLPVVTTPLGLRGFESLRPWVTVRDAEDFPAAIADSAWPAAIPAEALRPFSWEAIARRLADYYRALLTTEPNRSGKAGGW